MTKICDLAMKVRSKNAGPFWLTIDIFCGTQEVFERICAALDAERTAEALGTSAAAVKRFEVPDLNVLKISVPRPAVQGIRTDRDMHGASFANLLAELDI